MINIEFANKNDIDFLSENTLLSKDQIETKIKDKQLIIVFEEKKQIGLLVLDLLWNHIPFISYIWITKNNRKIGIGSSLLKFLEEYLKEKNEKVLFSSSMEIAHDAQKWHRKMGFTESGTIQKINKDNIGEVFFRKELV